MYNISYRRGILEDKGSNQQGLLSTRTGQKAVVKVNYVSTKLQAADSLTKFLKSGAEQLIHRELLGLQDECAGKGSLQACFVPDRIQVRCVRVSEQNPKPLIKTCNNLSSVAISAHARHDVLTIQQAPRSSLVVATEAMVRVVKEFKRNDWRFSTFQELKEDLKDLPKEDYLESLDAVDVLTLACKTDPLPVEKLGEETFEEYGCYRGSVPIIDSVLGDIIEVPCFSPTGKELGLQQVCRWAFIPINEKKVPSHFDRKEQDFRTHGLATCKNAGQMRSSTLQSSVKIH